MVHIKISYKYSNTIILIILQSVSSFFYLRVHFSVSITINECTCLYNRLEPCVLKKFICRILQLLVVLLACLSEVGHKACFIPSFSNISPTQLPTGPRFLRWRHKVMPSKHLFTVFDVMCSKDVACHWRYFIFHFFLSIQDESEDYKYILNVVFFFYSL